MISPLGPEEGIDLPMLETLELELVRKLQITPIETAGVESVEAPQVKPEEADQGDAIKLVYKSFEKERISFILRFEELDKEQQILQLRVWHDERKGT